MIFCFFKKIKGKWFISHQIEKPTVKKFKHKSYFKKKKKKKKSVYTKSISSERKEKRKKKSNSNRRARETYHKRRSGKGDGTRDGRVGTIVKPVSASIQQNVLFYFLRVGFDNEMTSGVGGSPDSLHWVAAHAPSATAGPINLSLSLSLSICNYWAGPHHNLLPLLLSFDSPVDSAAFALGHCSQVPHAHSTL